MRNQNESSAIPAQAGNSQQAANKRRVSRIDPAKYMPRLRADAPRMLRAYGSISKLADQLRIRRSDAIDLVLLALVEQRKPLQRRRRKP